METLPSTNGGKGRDTSGRFVVGWRGGPGNPHARRVARLRSAMLKAVKPDDLRDVIAALLAAAKGGDVSAARELLQRMVGPAEAIDLADRIAALEARLDIHPSGCVLREP